MSATRLDYIHHARVFGGLRAVWQTAASDTELPAVELGELALALRGIRSKRHGRKRETFSMTRRERLALRERLLAAGVGEAEAGRYADCPSHKGLAVTPPRPLVSTSPRPSHPLPAVRTCGWCGDPLPSSLRADARYCVGGSCRVAAHRARTRKVAA
jgi:hypothetical protein